MTMPSRGVFNASHGPLLQDTVSLDAAKELLRSTEEEDFVTALSFVDEKKAIAFAKCIHKCQIHGLKLQEKRFWRIAKALVAVKGRRADLYSQVIARLLVPEFFGGKSTQNGNGSGKSRKDAEERSNS